MPYPTLKQFKRQLLIDITARPAHPDRRRAEPAHVQSGQRRVAALHKNILNEIGHVLNDVQNRISLSGHTDAPLMQRRTDMATGSCPPTAPMPRGVH